MTAAVEVARTGGFAGVRDVVRVDGGGATVASRNAEPRPCDPPADALARLLAIDLAGLPAEPDRRPVPDGYVYAVTNGGHTVTLYEHAESGRRADLLDAAAALVTACLQQG